MSRHTGIKSTSLSLSEEQRRRLGAFLRRHREATVPALAPQARRRTPGLRREEVALMSGLSTTWYTWAEQGRDIALSDLALDRIARTLKLTAAERGYLFELARRRDPNPVEPSASAATTTPELLATLATISCPAYLLDPLWRLRGANPPAEHLFSPWLTSGEACLLRYVFLAEDARTFICDWEDRARRLLAEFRADTSHASDIAGMEALVGDLRETSADFRRLWGEQAVLAREGGRRDFRHPADGHLAFEQVTLVPAAHPDHKLVLLLPLKDEPAISPGGSTVAISRPALERREAARNPARHP